jgi:hypothetical protein
MYFCVHCAPCALISPIASPLCCSILSPTSFASSVHSLYCISLLTLNRLSWYLNFSAWFMWSMWELYEQKKVKLWSKWHFVEIKTDYASLCNNSDFHLNLGIFYMPQIYDMGPTAFLPFQRKACWGFFFRPKNPTASAEFEPANLGTEGQHATPRPPKPLCAWYPWKIQSLFTAVISD